MKEPGLESCAAFAPVNLVMNLYMATGRAVVDICIRIIFAHELQRAWMFLEKSRLCSTKQSAREKSVKRLGQFGGLDATMTGTFRQGYASKIGGLSLILSTCAKSSKDTCWCVRVLLKYRLDTCNQI